MRRGNGRRKEQRNAKLPFHTPCNIKSAVGKSRERKGKEQQGAEGVRKEWNETKRKGKKINFI